MSNVLSSPCAVVSIAVLNSVWNEEQSEISCPPATVVAANVSYNLRAIASAQQAAIAIGGDTISYARSAVKR